MSEATKGRDGFTEGPWKVHQNQWIYSNAGRFIAAVDPDRPRAEMDGNARLIAAAPSLLAALRRIERISARIEQRLTGLPLSEPLRTESVALRIELDSALSAAGEW